ncbi:nicotinate-nucleotide adenylyltransferase [Aliidiomarina sanyensis]|uniref:Probable nicotinate-nucleotide adenylyltransferase n=1 Tax=Aliidiomarina sanyensis TaxID=1249555 RepID=A0A432WES5_9GAMM|nr:nicotinate-nucleotide adenylyltransferase [Aliidiomarina sanyensis]RUO31381.1 nicotinic acid mononucleotide adenylyltransferase [Aliidiomarina sanyensis]
MQSNAPRKVAILGGTFDPVHWGHLKPALRLADSCGWDVIHLLPTCAPPHRQQPEVLNTHRLGMLDAAAGLDPRLVVNDWELRQGLPSRTLPTLKHFRERCPNATLVFIIGMDSLLNLPDWLHWERLFDYAHFVVMPRPGYTLEDARPEVVDLLAKRRISMSELESGHGGIFLAEAYDVPISATELRAQLAGQTECPEFLPEPVWQYIQKHHLYGVR